MSHPSSAIYIRINVIQVERRGEGEGEGEREGKQEEEDNRFWAGNKKGRKNGVRCSYMIPDVCGEYLMYRGERAGR